MHGELGAVDSLHPGVGLRAGKQDEAVADQVERRDALALALEPQVRHTRARRPARLARIDVHDVVGWVLDEDRR